MPIPPIGSVLTLECQGTAAGPRFLDGRTMDGTVGLAANSTPSGTQWALTMHAGDVITLKCMGDIKGPRFLDGRTMDGTVGLVPDTNPDNSGTRWSIKEEIDGITLRCLGLADGNRYLDGRTMDGTVGLAPSINSQFSGTRWLMTVTGKLVMVFCEGDDEEGKRFLDGRTGEGTVGLIDTTHDPFVGTRWHLSWLNKDKDKDKDQDNFTLKCLGKGNGPWYLDGDTVSGRLGLVPHTNPPYSGTAWKKEGDFLKCLGAHVRLNYLDGRTHDGTVALVADPDRLLGARWRILEPCSPSETHDTGAGAPVTVRVAQLTGYNDAENRPILNHTLGWGAMGLDLGANCVHSDGKIYIFLSDVVADGVPGVIPDSDLVASLAAPVLGGHEPEGFNFALPIEISTSLGQREWRYCTNCAALFFNGYPEKGVCPAAEDGHAAGDLKFAIPFGQADAGQREWRYCTKCHVMFFELFADRGVCAAGGRHVADGYRFVLPHGQVEGPHQTDWRFCKWCRGLFYGGASRENGACIAGGAAFRLQPVINPGIVFGPYFDPFTVSGLIQQTVRGETPTGAFSYEGQIYVFIWVGYRKDQHPRPFQGAYLVNKNDPGVAGPYEERFRLSNFQLGDKAFLQVAPWVVKNADIPDLPSADGDGLLMFGQGGHRDNYDAVHLAWMPLRSLQEAQQLHGLSGPQRPEDIRYFSNDPVHPWSGDEKNAFPLFTMPAHYTSVSVAWLEGPQRWILLYSKACGDQNYKRYNPTGSVVARLAKTPWDWEDQPEIEIFNPCREGAYGSYMHWQGLDTIFPDVPPVKPLDDQPGWAYGAHILNRFTRWHPKTRTLDIYYLLSLARPYQTQVMFTKMLVP